MASRDRGKLPNLKICVDNTKDAESEDELEDEKDIQIIVQSNETKKKGPDGSGSSSSGSGSDSSSGSSSSDSSSGSDSDQSDAESVEFNVRISGLTKDSQSKRRQEISKRYENKTGNFVTGIDLTSREAIEKKDERAKRFGLQPSEENRTEVDREALLKSLGIKQEDIDKGERGIRLEAIHMRGTDNMNTQDIFQYFSEFGPGRIEWIDDFSCNVVWFDPMTAARALSTLSRDYESVTGTNKSTDKTKSTDKSDKSTDPTESSVPDELSKELSKTSPEEDKTTEDSTLTSDKDSTSQTTEKLSLEEAMDVDNVLDLNADSDDDEGADKPDKVADTKQTNVENKTPEEVSDDKQTDGTNDPEMDTTEEKENQKLKKDKRHERTRDQKIIWPPGQWRFGQSSPKADSIFLRYATKADKKVLGAEQKSKYYMRHGNPNYGGQKGLISGSRKRKIQAKRHYEEYEKVKNAKPKGHDGESDHEPDSDVEVVDKPKELFTEKNKPREGDVPASLPSTEDIDNLDMEAELQELLGPPVKKRSMRMYADDIEDAQKISSRSRVSPGGLTIVADSRQGIESRLGPEVNSDTRDARFKITDARDRLSGANNRRSHSPYRHSRSDLRSKLKKRHSDSPDHLSDIKIEIFE